MGFWKGWALWQKLSIALAFLKLLVLVYSFSVLTYNRRKIRKQAAEEAIQRAEQEAEMGEAGSESNEIPFGARALEKGIEVEGIWTMKRHSHAKPASISEKRKSSILGSLLRHKSTASSVQTPHIIEPQSTNSSDPQRKSGSAESQAESVLESIHIDTFRSSRPPKLDIGGRYGQRSSENERPLSRWWFTSRSSWMKPIAGYKRSSVRDGKFGILHVLWPTEDTPLILYQGAVEVRTNISSVIREQHWTKIGREGRYTGCREVKGGNSAMQTLIERANVALCMYI
ncbi:hypothetical protein BDW71DRAFT_183342 [Aspergillus fruticulosus]